MTDKAPTAAQQLINALTHKQVWMQIQCTTSEPETDGKGAFVQDDKGKMVYRPNDKNWLPLIPIDIPEWVKLDAVIKKLHDGEQVSHDPGDGGRWYRGIITEKAITPEVPNDEVAH